MNYIIRALIERDEIEILVIEKGWIIKTYEFLLRERTYKLPKRPKVGARNVYCRDVVNTDSEPLYISEILEVNRLDTLEKM